MPSCRWRRFDLPGTDSATLTTTDAGYLLVGHATFRDSAGPSDLHYSVQVSPGWRTESARLHGVGPAGPLQLEIAVTPAGMWSLNGHPVPEVNGCIDVDLSMTPATNLVSIRRLALAPGASAQVVAAWLEFPELRFRVLRQLYRHLGGGRYAYRCPDLSYESVLETNTHGFVTSYPPFWGPEPTPDTMG